MVVTSSSTADARAVMLEPTLPTNNSMTLVPGAMTQGVAELQNGVVIGRFKTPTLRDSEQPLFS